MKKFDISCNNRDNSTKDFISSRISFNLFKNTRKIEEERKEEEIRRSRSDFKFLPFEKPTRLFLLHPAVNR